MLQVPFSFWKLDSPTRLICVLLSSTEGTANMPVAKSFPLQTETPFYILHNSVIASKGETQVHVPFVSTRS